MTAKRQSVDVANVLAGAVVDLDSAAITGGTTGKFVQASFSSSVPIRADMKTVAGAVVDIVDTRFAVMGGIWESPHADWVTLAGGASNKFRVTITNLDTLQTADVHATLYWDEV